MKWNSKVLMIIVFFTMISSWYSVYATPLDEAKNIVTQLQTTDTTLPSVTDQKWSIGRLLSLIFDVAIGKIKVDFLDILDTTGKIKTSLLPSAGGSPTELWQKSGNNIYYSTGSVGIGTSTFNSVTPTNSLQAQGEIISTISSLNWFRSVFWNYGAVWKNDWNDFMLGITYPWSDFKYNIPAFFPLKFNFIDERFTLSSNETKLTEEWADIMFRWGRASSWNTWQKANGYWNHFGLDNYEWDARIVSYYTKLDGSYGLSSRALLKVFWGSGWVDIGHDGVSPAIEIRANDNTVWPHPIPTPYIDFSNDNATSSNNFDARLVLTDNDTLEIQWATLKWAGFLNSIYPVGSIYTSTSPTNPSTLFGGTWSSFWQWRVLIGAGSWFSAGTTGWEASHTLTIAEMPNHQHYVQSRDSNADISWHYYKQEWVRSWDFNDYPGGQAYTNFVGGGSAHNNLPPYVVVYMWTRTG